ncbi:hypothetical protein O181_049783 [Austropuccinia psidii MF-1]|uniref:Uncharacterized protein n=1 Tax=Austropuccinia psidii MF-1 TaxID=1389203 RepID=A0A9Q3HLR8_9BASI|nr:hypothetical protein [Austropuccinia psidii MF-1]
MKSKPPNKPNILLKTLIPSSMDVSGLHIKQDVPMPPPPLINVLGITLSSITNPTERQSQNEYPPYPGDYLLTQSSKPPADQETRSHTGSDKKPMLNLPPLTEKWGIDQFQRSSEFLNCRGHQSQAQGSAHKSCEEGGVWPSLSTTEPMKTEDLVNKFNPRQTYQEVLSSSGQPCKPLSTEKAMKTDDSGDHSNESKTHHQNFSGSVEQRDYSESSSPQPGKDGSSIQHHFCEPVRYV